MDMDYWRRCYGLTKQDRVINEKKIQNFNEEKRSLWCEQAKERRELEDGKWQNRSENLVKRKKIATVILKYLK